MKARALLLLLALLATLLAASLFGFRTIDHGPEAESPEPEEEHSPPPAVTLAAAVDVKDGAKAEAPRDATVAGGDALSAADERLLLSINPAVTLNSNHTGCPPFRLRLTKSADSKTTQEAIAKYSRYTAQYCNTTGMLQMHFGLRQYVGFLDTIARVVGLRPGMRLFDWGSGCGTMLNYYALRYNTTGLGIDVTEPAVRHSQQHSQPGNTFCHRDGSNLAGFPAASFDAVVSWATLYHVRRTLLQCEIVHSLVRMLRPGGVAYIGHLRTEKTQDYWRKKNKCRPPGASLRLSRDFRMFRQPAFKRNGFFSLILVKDGGNRSSHHLGDE